MLEWLLFIKLPVLDKQLLDYLDAIGKIIVILGLPLAYFQYRRTKRKEKKDREYGTYNALDEKYLEFQKLCLDHSYLNIFYIPDEMPQVLNDRQKKEELILLTMLFSIFERAYLLYSDQYSDIKKKQWIGWDSYIKLERRLEFTPIRQMSMIPVHHFRFTPFPKSICPPICID